MGDTLRGSRNSGAKDMEFEVSNGALQVRHRLGRCDFEKEAVVWYSARELRYQIGKVFLFLRPFFFSHLFPLPHYKYNCLMLRFQSLAHVSQDSLALPMPCSLSHRFFWPPFAFTPVFFFSNDQFCTYLKAGCNIVTAPWKGLYQNNSLHRDNLSVLCSGNCPSEAPTSLSCTTY